MPIKIGSDGKVEAKELRVVGLQVKQDKQKKAKAKRKKSKDLGTSRGPKDCPYATLIEKDSDGRELYECNMWLYHSDSDCIIDGVMEKEWSPVRLMEGAELCVDCDRRPHIIEEEGKEWSKR